ncbi:MAG: hypothetical protein ABI426_02830, partial [Flavobacterium sp.]
KKAAKKEKSETKKLQILSLKKPIKEIQGTSKKHQKHKESDQILKEAQSAAILPSQKANQSAANHNQVVVMGDQTKDTKSFDKEGFEKKLKEQINDTIRRKEDADEIKRNGVDDKVTKKVSKTVGDEKTEAGGKIEASSIIPPSVPETPVGDATTQEPQMLGPVVPETKSLTAQKGDLAPVKHPQEETDFTKETEVLGDDYKQNNLSQDKLQNSNEPKFIAADNQKQDSETKAQELTDQTRVNEKKRINNTRAGNTNSINDGYNAMVQKQDSINKGRSDQQSKKSIEENQIRQDVHKQLNDIFTLANNTVLESFAAIDTYIEETFGKSLTQNLDLFSEQVAELLDDNDGIEWLGKKLTGSHVQDEIEIFNVAKKDFITHMQDPINELVSFVDKKLTKANQAIIDGRNNAKVFWDKQSDQTKKIADDIFKETDTKFGELESSVESKEGAIIDTVTEKFSEALTQLDERFEKAKIENMSWLDRAIAAVKSVINTIIELKNAIQSLAQKAAKYAEAIIDDPITFFGNLADGVGQGFTNFKNNIDKHLIKGVLEWLTGSMAGSDIILPKELNLEGITSLVLQILGITMKKIKDLVIDVIGKERFEFIEKGVDATLAAGNKILNIFKILNEKGLAGLWEFIQEEFSNLKDMLIENVKTFVVETITMKALEYLLSLLIPGAGFIRAAQLLIKFVITLFQKAAQIIKIIDGILDTFGDILNKNLGAVIAKVETVFSGFLSLAISFLAAVLGLDGIVGKVQKFIQQKIRPKIDQILKNIANKIKKIVEKIGLTKLIDKSMHAVEKGKAWVDDKKKKGKDIAKKYGEKFLNFLGIKKKFKTEDGEYHTLYFEGKEEKMYLMVASTPKTFADFLAGIGTVKGNKAAAKKQAEGEFDALQTALSKKNLEVADTAEYQKEQTKKFEKVTKHVVTLSNYMPPLFDIAGVGKFELNFGATNTNGYATKMEVKNLHKSTKPPIGSVPGVSNDGYELLKKKRNGSSTYYILGHLLNHNLGGSGNDFRNLTPLTRKGNKDHNVQIEETAKEDLKAGKVINYTVTPSYKKNTVKNQPTVVSAKKKVVIAAEEKTPVKVDYLYKSWDPKTPNNKKPASDYFDNNADFSNGTYDV